MNSCYRLSFVFSGIFFFYASSSLAQVNYTLGIGGGTYVYQGDLASGVLGSYRHLKPSLQLFAGKWLNPYFRAQLSFATAKLSSNDSDFTEPAYHQERNFRFNATLHELTAKLVFSPFGDGTIISDKRLYPYVFGGVGASFVNIQRDWSGATSAFLSDEKSASYLSADSAHGVPSVLLSIPVGAGISYSLSSRFSLYGEAEYHVPVTDYLDGFSYTANSDKKDNYYSFHIGVSYNLFRDNRTKCPTIKKSGKKFSL